jgi:hypothetical protein
VSCPPGVTLRSDIFNFAGAGPRFAAHARCAPAVAFDDFAPGPGLRPQALRLGERAKRRRSTN